MTTYRVRKWETYFENSQSRKCRALNWVPVPNKHDGKSYRRLISKPNGPALYGAWMLILQVASKCPTRGVLADDDGPLTADDVAAKTGCQADLLTEAFEVLSDPAIGWLEIDVAEQSGSTVGAEWEHATSTLPHHPAVSSLNRTEQNRKEKPPPPPSHKRSPESTESQEAAEVAKFLFEQCGIGDHAGAIATAKANNVPLAEVRAIAEHGMKQGYTPNQIHTRIKSQIRGAAITAGWIGQKTPPKPAPDVSPEVRDAEERLASLPFDERMKLAREYLPLSGDAFADYQRRGRDSPHRWRIAQGIAAVG